MFISTLVALLLTAGGREAEVQKLPRLTLTSTLTDVAPVTVTPSASSPSVVLVVPDQQAPFRLVVFGGATARPPRFAPVQQYLADGRVDATATPSGAGEYVVVLEPAGAKSQSLKAVPAAAVNDPLEVVGAPAPGAPPEERQVGRFMQDLNTLNRLSEPERAAAAVRLFETLPLEFFVYPHHALQGVNEQHPPGPSEPVLNLGNQTVLTVDGLVFTALEGQPATQFTAAVPGDLTTTAPARVEFSPARPIKIRTMLQGETVWDHPDFLPFLDAKERKDYGDALARATKCFDDQMAKLDPNYTAGRYDLITTRNGQVTKVENLADKLQKKALATCKMPAVEAQRKKLEGEVVKSLPARRDAMVARVLARFAH